MKQSTTTHKRIRQSDIAKAVGVSQRAVSVVLGQSAAKHVGVSKETADRIRIVAARLGYEAHLPAQQMKGVRSGMIGVLIGAAEVSDTHRRLSRIEFLAREKNYRLVVGHLRTNSDLDYYTRDFKARMVEGVICMRHELEQQDIPASLAQMQNVVYLDPPQGVQNACCVQMDRRSGISQACAHLARLGRRKIATMFATPLDPAKQGLPMRERILGYRDGVTAAGQTLDEKLIWMNSDLEATGKCASTIDSAISELVIERGVDAILASNDMVALAVIKRLRAAGIRVPEDVAIVGYSNMQFSEFADPGLTTLDPKHDHVAKLLTEMLFSLMNGEPIPADQRHIMVKPRLLVRESCGGNGNACSD